MVNDLAASVPASLTVTFPRPDGTAAAYPVTLASLGLPEFQGVTGFPGSALLHSTALANAPAGTTPPNDAELAALARQLAADWYRHRVAPHDVLYAGVAPWVPSGFTDVVEWAQTPRQVTTRARRGPWLDHREEVFHHGSAGSAGGGTGTPSAVGPGQTFTLQAGSTIVEQGLVASPLPAAVTLASASYNNYALPTTSSLVVFNPTVAGGVTLTGLVPAVAGQVLTVVNNGSVPVFITSNDSSSLTTNQLSTTWGGPLVIWPCGSATLQAGKGPGGQWGVLNPGWPGQIQTKPSPTATLTTSLNDYPVGGYGQLNFDPAGGDFNLTGLQGGYPGLQMTVTNAGTSGTLTLTPNDPASSPGNQLSLAGAASVTLQPGQSLDLSVGAGGSFGSTTSLNGGGGGGTLAPGGGVPGWVTVTMGAGDFSAAATTNTVTVYTLPAYSVIHGVLVKHTAAFTGGTLTGYNLLSVQGATTYFGGSGSYNLFAAPANVGQGKWQPWAQSGYGSMEDAGSPKVITATVQSIGGNLSQATGGSVRLHFLVSTPSSPVAVPPVSQQPPVMYMTGFLR